MIAADGFLRTNACREFKKGWHEKKAHDFMKLKPIAAVKTAAFIVAASVLLQGLDAFGNRLAGDTAL